MYKLLSKFASDKLLHAFGGAIIFLALYQPFSFISAIVTVITIAVLKEVIDLLSGKGKCEWMDIVFTVSGGLIAFAVKTIIQFIYPFVYIVNYLIS